MRPVIVKTAKVGDGGAIRFRNITVAPTAKASGNASSPGGFCVGDAPRRP